MVLKACNNHRPAPTLPYGRARIGAEVDLLLDHGDTLTPVEFKAGQTVAADWVEPLDRYRSRADRVEAGPPRIAPAQIVYGGGEPRTRSGVAVARWHGWPERALTPLRAA